jgi:hypothetical protein
MLMLRQASLCIISFIQGKSKSIYESEIYKSSKEKRYRDLKEHGKCGRGHAGL